MTPQECLVTYAEAWFERDPARRVEVLRRCCTEDIVFMDSELGRLQGFDEVSAMIGSFVGGTGQDASGEPSEAQRRGRSGSGLSVEVVSPVDVRHRFFRFSFVWKFPDGRRRGGTDFGEFAEDGRMSLITVWPASPDFPVAGAD